MPDNQQPKSVPPLIIPKSRLQSVSNNNVTSQQISDQTDGFTVKTNKNSRNGKHSLPHSPSSPTQQSKTFVSSNRFSLFSNYTEPSEKQNDNQSTEMDLEPETTTPIIKPPPPIFIRVVNDFNAFCNSIKKLIKSEHFSCKSSTNGVKLSTTSADSYRLVIKFLQESKADFHTYQLKQDRAYRVILRNLHHTTPIEEIKNELLAHGHQVRNITNVLQRNTKLPLPLFFIDLEPAINNKDIFSIGFLYYTKIKIEEPRANNLTIQCLRCQAFGHTKSYCNHPPKCVRCGANHLSTSCQKSQSLPAKCALCSGDHPANYRGCPVHKEFQSTLQSKKTSNPQSNYVHPTSVNATSISASNFPKTYAQATTENANNPTNLTPPDPDISLKLSSFLEELKNLICPLISLLTTVINKLIVSKDDK